MTVRGAFLVSLGFFGLGFLSLYGLGRMVSKAWAWWITEETRRHSL